MTIYFVLSALYISDFISPFYQLCEEVHVFPFWGEENEVQKETNWEVG